ncbi:hypothetical protein T01_7755 [Trichinella spiralis]|uniref:Uncharacterized protein n=1 Tax=Trichinella spiralis TaxID=6334 RepID=A0A0V0ZRY1_TRISP|nr:hypothetical protein T01_7755 [Trichinella spiralis]
MKENQVAQNKEILNKSANWSSSMAAFLCIKIGTWQL